MLTRYRNIQNTFHKIREKNYDDDFDNFYGTPVLKYKVLEEDLSQIDNLYDKIAIAQKCRDFNMVNQLIINVENELSNYSKNKLTELLKKNKDIYNTLHFRLLDERFKFLDKYLDLITTDPQLQLQIVGLNDNRLRLFEKMLQYSHILTSYPVSIITKIALFLSGFTFDKQINNEEEENFISELEKNIDEIGDNEIESLLFVVKAGGGITFRTYEEFKNYVDSGININNENVDKEIKNGTISIGELKKQILINYYGISLGDAKRLIERYNLNGIEVVDENRDAIEIYEAIRHIYNENDISVLLELYSELRNTFVPHNNFMKTVVLENELRSIFAKELNRAVVDISTLTPIPNNEGVGLLDGGNDFKMIITSVGAYTPNLEIENYQEYWNSPQIQTHCNCCSLVANNNMAMADVNNVIFGFDNFNEDMLLLSNVSDMNSTPVSLDVQPIINGQKYMAPEEMINNTRADYNELVYERRNLSPGAENFKKQPSYILFVEEYEDFDVYYQKLCQSSPVLAEKMKTSREKELTIWENSVKAAKDFGIPIVKVNRESLLKNERKKLLSKLNDFRMTRDPNMIGWLIEQFENNRASLGRVNHELLQHFYYSDKTFQKLLDAIKQVINNVQDEEEQNMLQQALRDALLKEKEKQDNIKHVARNHGETPAINFKAELGD